jgi:hypothetical protein
MFSRRPVARLSMMTTSWCCANVSARFEARAGPAGDDGAHEEFTLSAGLGFSELSPGYPSSRGTGRGGRLLLPSPPAQHPHNHRPHPGTHRR